MSDVKEALLGVPYVIGDEVIVDGSRLTVGQYRKLRGFVEFRAKLTAVWGDSKNGYEVTLKKGQIYDFPTKDKNGDPDQYSRILLKSLLKIGLIELVDTRPIDEDYIE